MACDHWIAYVTCSGFLGFDLDQEHKDTITKYRKMFKQDTSYDGDAEGIYQIMLQDGYPPSIANIFAKNYLFLVFRAF